MRAAENQGRFKVCVKVFDAQTEVCVKVNRSA